MRHVLVAIVICGGLVAGCGSDGGDASNSSDQQQAADVAKRYLQAVVARDWKAACETRTRKERTELSRLGGSCARALAAAFAGKQVTLFEGARVGDVRIDGSKAGIDVLQPGQDEPVITLVAVREGATWRLEDVPDAQAP